MRPRATSAWLPYIIAALAIVVASLLGRALAPTLGDNVLYVTFFSAVTFAAWQGGLWPAVFATFLSYLIANLVFIPKDRAFVFDVASFAYLFVCLAIACFSEAMRRALGRAAASAEQVVSLVEGISDGFVAVDSYFHCTYMNRAAEEFQRRHRGDGLARHTGQIFPLESSDEAQRRLREAAAARTTAEFIEYYPPWGRWFEIKASPADAGGLAIQFRDITERKVAEDNLRFFSEAGKVLSAVTDLDHMTQSIARHSVPFLADWCVIDVLDSLGEIERVAHAHRDLAKQPILKQLVERVPLDWNSSLPVMRVLRSGQSLLMSELPPEFINEVAQDEHHRQLLEQLDPRSLLIVPLVVREHTIGTLSLLTSESGRRFSTADLALAEELARRAANAIDNARLYRDLTTAERQKDDFLAMLAHELRNPLAAILYANEMLKLSGENQGGPAEVIDRQLGNLTHLIDDLLDVSRITRDKIQLKKEGTSAAELVSRALTTAGPAIEGRNHQLRIEVAEKEMPLLVDPVRVEQILVNLLTNAAKYTAEGGQITVRCFPQDGHAIFKIHDTGIGIAAEMLPRVFELFTQVDKTLDRSQGGLGIGLTVVRKLVEMHGGRVSARSEGVGRGSEFTVGLPLSREIPHSAAAPAQPAMDASARKVLVVDDNVDTANSISMLLKSKGFTVALAHDGHAALDVARGFGPDVVLLDLGLPGIDGYRVAQILRSEAEFAKVRIIALSGYGQPSDRVRSREAGFNDHLVKPVAFEKLLSSMAIGSASGHSA